MSGDPSATGSAVSAPLSEWRADLRRATWVSASVLRLHGWAFDRYAPEAEGDWEVWLEGALPGGEPTQIPGSVTSAPSDEVNAVARDGNHDRRTSAFVADIDLRAIVTTAPASEFASSWTVTVARTIDGHQSSGGFTGRDRTGSAGTIPTRFIEGCFVRCDWTAEGLVLTVARRAATVIDAYVTDRTVHATVRVVGARPTGVIFTRGSDAVVEGTLSAAGTVAAGLVEISVPVGVGGIDPAGQAKWYGHLTLPAGKRRFCTGDWTPTGSATGRNRRVRSCSSGARGGPSGSTVCNPAC